MRLIYISIKLKIKELWCDKAYVGILFLLPILIGLFAGYGTKHMQEMSLKVGIYVEENTTLGEQMKALLVEDQDIEFKAYESQQQMEEDVATSKIECGFIIQDEIEEVMRGKSSKKVMIMLTSPATMASGPIQETVNAVFFKLIASDIAVNTIKDKDYMQEVTDIKDVVEDKVNEYYQNGNLMKVKLVTSKQAKSEEVNVENTGVVQLCKGLIGAFLFVASLLLGTKLTKERKTGLYKRLITVKKASINLEEAMVVASSICQIIVGILSFIVLYSIVGMQDIILLESIRLVLYIGVMNMSVLCMSLWIREEQIWFGVISVLSIACLIFCPVIVDLSAMNSILKYGSYLFPTYYYLVGAEMMLMGIGIISLIVYIGYSSRGYRSVRK